MRRLQSTCSALHSLSDSKGVKFTMESLQIASQPPYQEKKIIPLDHIQLSHAKRLRAHPRELGIALIQRQKGSKNACGHEGIPTFDHINAEEMYCTVCKNIHQDHSVENGLNICFFCNSKKGGFKPSDNQSMSERKHFDATAELKKRIDYSNGSAEMQVSEAEIDFRDFIRERVKLLIEYSKKEAINSGAERTGANPQTTRRWLAKLVSDEGEYEEVKNEQKQKVIRMKNQDLLKLQKISHE